MLGLTKQIKLLLFMHSRVRLT